MKSYNENNNIVLFGKLKNDFLFSHELYGEKFFESAIECPRLSNEIDVLTIQLSERLIDINTINEKSIYKIDGQIRTYNVYDKDTKKNKLKILVFVNDIEKVSEDAEIKNNNEVKLNAFIVKKPVYRTTPFGREIVDLLLAVNRSYNKSDYIPGIAWGRNARFCDKLRVGDNVEVCGRLQCRHYQKKNENGELIDKIAYELSISKIVYKEVNNQEEK